MGELKKPVNVGDSFALQYLKMSIQRVDKLGCFFWETAKGQEVTLETIEPDHACRIALLLWNEIAETTWGLREVGPRSGTVSPLGNDNDARALRIHQILNHLNQKVSRELISVNLRSLMDELLYEIQRVGGLKICHREVKYQDEYDGFPWREERDGGGD